MLAANAAVLTVSAQSAFQDNYEIPANPDLNPSRPEPAPGGLAQRQGSGCLVPAALSPAGKSAESKLIRRLVDGDGGMQMPPAGALLPEEIGIRRAWIDQGAEFRNDVGEDAI